MKTLICLLATACVCNATLLSLFADKGSASQAINSYSSHAHGGAHSYHRDHNHGHYHSRGFGSSPSVYQVILDQRHSGDHIGAGGYSYGHGSEAQTHTVHGYAASNNPSYASSDFDSFTSQFNAILPQILQLILEDNDSHGGHARHVERGGRSGHNDHIYGTGSALSSQLAAHYGHSGIAFVRRSNGKSNSYYSDGRVLEKGVLEIRAVEEAPVHSVPVYGPSAPHCLKVPLKLGF